MDGAPQIWHANGPRSLSRTDAPDLARSPQHAAGVGERLAAMIPEAIEQRPGRPAHGFSSGGMGVPCAALRSESTPLASEPMLLPNMR
jgi:hypothetical protein